LVYSGARVILANENIETNPSEADTKNNDINRIEVETQRKNSLKKTFKEKTGEYKNNVTNWFKDLMGPKSQKNNPCDIPENSISPSK